MSKVKTTWDRLKTETNSAEEFESVYSELFGPYFSNGLNIGREVIAKLVKKDYMNIWPTMLQAEGMDSGLTAGFLTACSICPIDEELSSDPFRHLPQVMRTNYQTSIVTEEIQTMDQLLTDPRYSNTDYVRYPYEQKWTMPAVMISYLPLSN